MPGVELSTQPEGTEFEHVIVTFSRTLPLLSTIRFSGTSQVEAVKDWLMPTSPRLHVFGAMVSSLHDKATITSPGRRSTAVLKVWLTAVKPTTSATWMPLAAKT